MAHAIMVLRSESLDPCRVNAMILSQAILQGSPYGFKMMFSNCCHVFFLHFCRPSCTPCWWPPRVRAMGDAAQHLRWVPAWKTFFPAEPFYLMPYKLSLWKAWSPKSYGQGRPEQNIIKRKRQKVVLVGAPLVQNRAFFRYLSKAQSPKSYGQ
jgi:hypothetical protein